MAKFSKRWPWSRNNTTLKNKRSANLHVINEQKHLCSNWWWSRERNACWVSIHCRLKLFKIASTNSIFTAYSSLRNCLLPFPRISVCVFCRYYGLPPPNIPTRSSLLRIFRPSSFDRRAPLEVETSPEGVLLKPTRKVVALCACQPAHLTDFFFWRCRDVAVCTSPSAFCCSGDSPSACPLSS